MALAEWLIAFTQWAEGVVGAYGYLGIFLVSLIGNFSIIFPIPAFALVFSAGAVLNPWLVGLAGGAGAALGETSGYLLGRGGSEAIKKKYSKQLHRVRKWTLKHGIFPIIILFAATPLPSDVIGIFSGLIKYSYKKFLLASVIGKLFKYTLIALAGAYSFEAIKMYFGV